MEESLCLIVNSSEACIFVETVFLPSWVSPKQRHPSGAAFVSSGLGDNGHRETHAQKHHVPYIYSSWKINELRPYKSSKAPYTYTYSSWKIKHTQTLQKLKESHWLVIAVQFLTGYTMTHDHCGLFPRICCTKLPLQFISNRSQQDYVHFFQEGNFDTYHL